MIFEILVASVGAVGCMACWAIVQKHRITSELQKHKIDTEYKALNAARPELELPKPSLRQQALTTLLARRATLEFQIDGLRRTATNLQLQYGTDISRQQRTDALQALKDARKEQQELIIEQEKLLNTNSGESDEKIGVGASEESVQLDPGGHVAQRVDDPGDMPDAEPDKQEASRTGAA